MKNEKMIKDIIEEKFYKKKNYERIMKFLNNTKKEELNYPNLRLTSDEELAYIRDNVYLDNDETIDMLKNHPFSDIGVINMHLIYKEINNETYIGMNVTDGKMLYIIDEDVMFIADTRLKIVLCTYINFHAMYVYHYGNIDYPGEYYEKMSNIYYISVCQVIKTFTDMANQDKTLITVNKKVIGKNKKNKLLYNTNYSLSLNNVKKYIYDKNYLSKREYKRHTESWNVRGFWRTYKSGKKVWIKPSVRGNKNSKPKNQKYTL